MHIKSEKSLDVAVFAALGRSYRKSDSVSTIVVDGVSFTNPFETFVLVNIQVLKLFLIPPTFSLRLAQLCIHRNLTSIDVESSV